MRYFMRHSGSRAACAAAALSLLALAGCDQIDPLKRPYMWYAAGVNTRNIGAMAANPTDLAHGRDAPIRRSALDSDSVDRLWNGKVLPLPSDTPGSTVAAPAATGGGGSSSTSCGGS
jgi:hypothetical protein